MFIHDIIKIYYVNEGYLPNYPYHLTTDKEMFDAFIRDDGYFANTYPCPTEELQDAYDTLREYIASRIDSFLNEQVEVPAWIYSYMIGAVVGPESSKSDLGDLYTLTGLEATTGEPEFTADLATECYAISSGWLKKQISASAQRPATMFGEPHVFKSLRLAQADIVSSQG